MNATSLSLLVAAAPIGSVVEALGVHSEREWVETAGRVMQYVSSASLVVLGTTAAVWAAKPKWTAAGIGLTTLFVAFPVAKRLGYWHPQLDAVASVLLKLSSTATLSIASFSTTPLLLVPIGCHLLPYVYS